MNVSFIDSFIFFIRFTDSILLLVDDFIVNLIECNSFGAKLIFDFIREISVMDENNIVRSFKRESFHFVHIPISVDEDESMRIQDVSVILANIIMTLITMANNETFGSDHERKT